MSPSVVIEQLLSLLENVKSFWGISNTFGGNGFGVAAALQNKRVSFDLKNVKTDVVNTDAFFQGYLELFLFHQNVL